MACCSRAHRRRRLCMCVGVNTRRKPAALAASHHAARFHCRRPAQGSVFGTEQERAASHRRVSEGAAVRRAYRSVARIHRHESFGYRWQSIVSCALAGSGETAVLKSLWQQRRGWSYDQAGRFTRTAVILQSLRRDANLAWGLSTQTG